MLIFPPEAVKAQYLCPSATPVACPWKGIASDCDVVVNGKENRDAAWLYPQACEAAKQVQGRIAFWHGVRAIA